MSGILKWLSKLPPLLLGLLFFGQAVLALVRPESAIRVWGFAVPDDGAALSAMVGLIVGYCLTLGLSLLLALFRSERFWYYAPMMMFFGLGLGRLVAGAVHGADFLPARFIPEFVFVGLLYLSSRASAPART